MGYDIFNNIGKPPNREGIEKKLSDQDKHVSGDCVGTKE